MVEISDCKDKCFAKTESGCRVTSGEIECSPRCAFYKPIGCEDWVKTEWKGKIWLIPPEEYATKGRKRR